jgi:hypothetical protein
MVAVLVGIETTLLQSVFLLFAGSDLPKNPVMMGFLTWKISLSPPRRGLRPLQPPARDTTPSPVPPAPSPFADARERAAQRPGNAMC